MIPGSKAKNHDVLAQEWFYGSFVIDVQNDHKFQEEYIS